MHTSDSFHEFLGRLEAKDPTAAAELFHRFVYRLIGLARLQLDEKLRRVTDAEDVVQSVFKSFFVRVGDGRMEFGGWGDLWSLLAVITVRKCARQRQRQHAAGRDVNREVTPPECWEPLSREPTAAEAAMLSDTVEYLLRGLDEREHKLVTLRLQGFSVAEISTAVQRTERTVHRVLAQVRQRLQDMDAFAAADD
jgi:RNA polymerase sigma-70 factor (ECF subfamily)